MTDATRRLSETLGRLSNAVGVAGAESEVRKLILDMIKDNVEDVIIDPIGNVTAFKRSTGQAPLRVMLAAHMDESGFMVTSVTDNGLINIVEVGAHDERVVPTQRVSVGKDKTPGVLLWPPIHKTADQPGIVKIKTMQVDVGADSKSGAKAKPGDYIAFLGAYTELHSTVVRGKAFDSRAGCAVVLELLQGEPLAFDLHVAFTAQQEIGGRGAGVAAHRINPDVAFVLRGSECNDFPGEPDDDRAPVVRLGGGPALTVVDPGVISHRRLIDHLAGVAYTRAIPYQIDAQNILRSDGGTISLSQTGIPVAVVGIPVRYMRSPNALLNLDDLENTVRLMRESLTALAEEPLTS